MNVAGETDTVGKSTLGRTSLDGPIEIDIDGQWKTVGKHNYRKQTDQWGVPVNVDLPVIDHSEVASGQHRSTSGDRVVSVSTGTNVIDVDTAPSSVKILEDRLERWLITTTSTEK